MESLTKMIKKGSIKSPIAVWKEIQRQRDEIYKFLKKFPNLFTQPDYEEQQVIAELVNDQRFNKWGKGDSEHHYADPYVVALAKVHDLNVVTYETGRHNNTIGLACEILEVECIRFSDVLRLEKLNY